MSRKVSRRVSLTSALTSFLVGRFMRDSPGHQVAKDSLFCPNIKNGVIGYAYDNLLVAECDSYSEWKSIVMNDLLNAHESSVFSFLDGQQSLIPSKSSHQLIVIGNGFDLACGIKSGFASFFEPRMHALGVCRESEGGSQFKKMSEFGLTAWDIVLSASYPEFAKKEYVNWSDVELAIDYVIRPENHEHDSQPHPHLDSRSIHNAVFSLRKEIPGTEEGLRSKEGFADFNDIDLLQQFDLNPPASENKEIASYLIWKHPDLDDWSIRSMLRVLLKELHELENEFDKYLTEVVHNFKPYASISAALLRELVAAEEQLFGDTEVVKTTVLSFNYTTPGEISLRNRRIDEAVHVHGKLGEGVVFGIDGTDCMDNPDALHYTKTYRLLSSKNAHPRVPIAYPPSQLLGADETVAIKFFGHSLAEADYAYFQSMFDMTELYSGRVTLCFYYSDYCDEEEDRTYERVTNLLASYGKTMDNEDHGKNLIHKLLLENRLIIRSLNFS